ncbi:MAG: ArsA family ATPase [Deltaproteobacteria bacterium]|nr:ArsA family ATPase [Deltaproteobacteria bacterium]
MKPGRLASHVREKNVVICCGSGGVGKTTVAASVGLRAAIEGRKVLVLTIDPARRLANALGIDVLENSIKEVPREKFEAAGIEFKGSLSAMMLDTKREWDDVVRRYAPDSGSRDKILGNRLYNYLSNHLVGAGEFMAMERLYYLHQQGDYDLVVLDTPPTKHALDFLEAPRKLFSFLEDGTFVNAFLKPYTEEGGRPGVGMRMLKFGTTAVFKVLEMIIGGEILRDISEFVGSFEGYYQGFKGRAYGVDALLRQPTTSFLLVTSPSKLTLTETRYFYDRLREAQMPFGGFIINRVHNNFLPPGVEIDPLKLAWVENPADRKALLDRVPEISGLKPYGGKARDLMGDLLDTYANMEILAAGEQKNLELIQKVRDPKEFFIQVPFFDRDIFDAEGLLQFNQVLFDDGHLSA